MAQKGKESMRNTDKPVRNILIAFAIPVTLLAAEGIRFLFTSRWSIYSDAIFGVCSNFFLFSALALWIYIYLLGRYRTSQAVLTVSCLGLVFFVFLATILMAKFVWNPMLKDLLHH
jgi:hypothetical protein